MTRYKDRVIKHTTGGFSTTRWGEEGAFFEWDLKKKREENCKWHPACFHLKRSGAILCIGEDIIFIHSNNSVNHRSQAALSYSSLWLKAAILLKYSRKRIEPHWHLVFQSSAHFLCSFYFTANPTSSDHPDITLWATDLIMESSGKNLTDRPSCLSHC